MKRAVLLLAAIASLLAVPAVAKNTAPAIVDLMGPFFAAESAQRPLSERLTLFKERLLYPHVELYDNGYSALDDVHLAWYLQRESAHVQDLRAMDARLLDAVPKTVATFSSAFPKFDSSSLAVYLMPSLGSFDGMTEDVGSHHGLLLGVDNIAAEQAPVGVLVDHELFHVYHHDANPAFFPTKTENDLYRYGVYREVWAEGLATFVSRQLNPGTSAATVLFSAGLAGLNTEKTKALACFVEQRLDSQSLDDARLLFDAGRHPDDLPARGGYYVGYLVARALSSSMTLAQLADLHGKELESSIRSHVHALCENGAI